MTSTGQQAASGNVGGARIVPPEGVRSFWQPVPANGFVRCLLDDQSVTSRTPFAMGTQTVAPGCHVREHTHDRHEEIIYILSGTCIIKLDGEEQPLPVGSAVFLGTNRRHSFINPGPGDMTFLWFLLPGGLERFFAAIGRPRREGEPAPPPFPRPENVAEIERRTVFGWADPSYNQPKP